MASKTLPSAQSRPFDAVAEKYDADFTERLLGRWLRGMVWQRLEPAFEPGQHVLELGCGTGEDAIWLARRGVFVTATDASSRMLEMTRLKVDRAGVGDHVSVEQLDLESLQGRESADNVNVNVHQNRFDGVVSNFGPLNCVHDRAALASRLVEIVEPGGKVVLVVMGPVCPWEVAWYLGHGDLRSAFRRFRSGQPARVGTGETVRVWYPSIRRLSREFSPYFRVIESAGIGLLLPPSALGGIVERAPKAFALLAYLDNRLAGTWAWRWLSDHYLIVLERR